MVYRILRCLHQHHCGSVNRSWRRTILAVIVLTVVTLFAGAVPVSAHSWTDMFWDPAFNRYFYWESTRQPVNFWLAKSVLDKPAEWRLRIIDAATTWNKLGQVMRFNYAGDVPINPAYREAEDLDCPTIGPGTASDRSAIQVDQLDYLGSGVFGVTYYCVSPGTSKIYVFHIAMDTDSPWYTGTGSVPSDKHDFQGSVTHELGHAAGWGPGHYRGDDSSTTICGQTNLDLHTMCGNSNYAGQVRRRTLEEHDMHTYRNAYPTPTPPSTPGVPGVPPVRIPL